MEFHGSQISSFTERKKYGRITKIGKLEAKYFYSGLVGYLENKLSLLNKNGQSLLSCMKQNACVCVWLTLIDRELAIFLYFIRHISTT